MNAPQQWRTPPHARHLRVEDIDAEYEARRRRWRRFDRACGLFGLALVLYFAVQLLRPWL